MGNWFHQCMKLFGKKKVNLKKVDMSSVNIEN